jgi:hypothetical protein
MRKFSLSIMIIMVAALALYAAPAALALSGNSLPSTTCNAPSGWVNTTTTVTFVAANNGAGVSRTEFNVDGGGWLTGTQVTIAADPIGHTTDGMHSIAYRSVDSFGNVEAAHTAYFGIDTSAPTTAAMAYIPMYTYDPPRIVVNGTAMLGYSVFDNDPCGGAAAVTIAIRNLAGTLVKTLKYNNVSVNIPFYATFKWTLAAGTYTYGVRAVDTAGNSQSKTGTRTFKAYAN